jgi:hypothetical protein
MGTMYYTFAFLTFSCWLAWRKRSRGAKMGWFVLVVAGGNITISLYELLQVVGLRPDGLASALFRQNAP